MANGFRAGLVFLILFGTSCQTSSQETTKSIDTQNLAPSARGSKETQQEELPAIKEPDPCTALPTGQTEIPSYLPTKGIVITRLSHRCSTRRGEPGFLPEKVSWIAMGFPCTGENAKVTWLGKLAAPKALFFNIDNSCKMQPGSVSAIENVASQTLGLPQSAKLLGYYPLAVQFWELVDYPDFNIGHNIRLRSQKSIRNGWKGMKTGTPLRVRLYGRENSWIKPKDTFRVEATIQLVDQRFFRMKVGGAQAMADDEILAMQSKCRQLHSIQSCQKIFNTNRHAELIME